jgi:uncharacterized membrane protein YbhN (UPF0104 family)
MLILAALLVIALLQLDRNALIYSISQIPLWLLILMLALQVVTQILVNLQWYAIARLGGLNGLSFWKLFYINSQGAIVDAITPGVKIGGEITRAVQISRVGDLPAEEAAAVVAMQKLFSLSALFIILIVVSGSMPFSPLWIIPAIALLFAIIFILSKKIQKLQNFLLNMAAAFKNQIKNIRKNPVKWALLALLSLAIWVFYPIKMYIIAIQFAPDLSLANAAAITFAAYMVAMLPIFPGGLGGFEATMSGLLVATGLILSDAAIITIFFRFATFWFIIPLSLGFIGFNKIRNQKSEIRGQKKSDL